MDRSLDEEIDLEKFPKPKRFLRPDLMPLLSFRRHLTHLRNTWAFWHQVAWFYHNLDVEVFDRWYAEQCQFRHDEFLARAEARMGAARDFARARSLPLVLDENTAFYPPFQHLSESPSGTIVGVSCRPDGPSGDAGLDQAGGHRVAAGCERPDHAQPIHELTVLVSWKSTR